ncbi:hypothetical protein R6Q59_005264 [Mikania micrantha]
MFLAGPVVDMRVWFYRVNFRILLVKIYRVILVITGFFFIVARSQSDSDSDADAELVVETIKEGVDVGHDGQDFGLGNFTPAPDVETLCFPCKMQV